MIYETRHKGFSLVEVMMSAGILAIGFVLIAGAFPVGVKLTAIATERTIGMTASSEALAKIKLYGVDFSLGSPPWPGVIGIAEHSQSVDFDLVKNAVFDDAVFDEHDYPSTNLIGEKKYRWSGLCRYLGSNKIQVTVFVCRVAGPGVLYPKVKPDGTLAGGTTNYPKPVKIKRDTSETLSGTDDNIIHIDAADDILKKYVTAGTTLVDDATGVRMEVIERDDKKLTLLNGVDEDVLGDHFWVIPPSVRSDLKVSGRYPCVAVEQDAVITF